MNYRRLQSTNVSAIITDETDDYTVEFRVSGTISPYIPARIYGDPDDCYPAEGGEIEIESVEFVSLEGASPGRIPALVAAFDARIETDKKLRDYIYERLAEAAADADDGPDPDRYRD